MSDTNILPGKHYGDSFTRAKQSLKYGTPMDPDEDEWEGNEPSREELIGEFGSDYDSAHSFDDVLIGASTYTTWKPHTLPHPSIDWSSIALHPPSYIGPRGGNDDEKNLKEIIQSMDLTDSTWLLLSHEDHNSLVLEAKKDLDSIEEQSGGYLDAGETMNYMKRCRHRFKAVLHHQDALHTEDGSIDGIRKMKRMKISETK